MSGFPLRLGVDGVGLCCPVGLYAEAACAAMRAGLAVIEELDELVNLDADGEPLYGSYLSTLHTPKRTERLAALLEGALADLGGRVSPATLSRCPAILITRAGRPKTEQALLAVMPDRDRVATLRGGSSAAFEALAAAARWIADGASQVLICAADCLITALDLHDLRKAGRLRGVDSPHGVIPGEAAACVLVSRFEPRPGAVEIASYGAALEPATPSNDVPVRSVGLTEAIRAALVGARVEMDNVGWRLADHGDETQFVKEQDMALARLLRAPRADMPMWQPAEFIGHVGVASGLVQLIWTTQAWACGYAPGDLALCVCSEPAGSRAAIVLRCQAS